MSLGWVAVVQRFQNADYRRLEMQTHVAYGVRFYAMCLLNLLFSQLWDVVALKSCVALCGAATRARWGRKERGTKQPTFEAQLCHGRVVQELLFWPHVTALTCPSIFLHCIHLAGSSRSQLRIYTAVVSHCLKDSARERLAGVGPVQAPFGTLSE